MRAEASQCDRLPFVQRSAAASRHGEELTPRRRESRRKQRATPLYSFKPLSSATSDAGVKRSEAGIREDEAKKLRPFSGRTARPPAHLLRSANSSASAVWKAQRSSPLSPASLLFPSLFVSVSVFLLLSLALVALESRAVEEGGRRTTPSVRPSVTKN